MIRPRVQPRRGEPVCSCGRNTMRFCVTRYSYCGRQAVAISNHWRKRLGIKRASQGEEVKS